MQSLAGQQKRHSPATVRYERGHCFSKAFIESRGSVSRDRNGYREANEASSRGHHSSFLGRRRV